SLLANGDEVAAIRDLARHGGCSVYLFNEACANCAWTSARIQIDAGILGLANSPLLGDLNPVKYVEEIGAILDRIYQRAVGVSMQVDLSPTGDWNALRSDFILNGVRSATLNLLSDNEGNHQEQ